MFCHSAKGICVCRCRCGSYLVCHSRRESAFQPLHHRNPLYVSANSRSCHPNCKPSPAHTPRTSASAPRKPAAHDGSASCENAIHRSSGITFINSCSTFSGSRILRQFQPTRKPQYMRVHHHARRNPVPRSEHHIPRLPCHSRQPQNLVHRLRHLSLELCLQHCSRALDRLRLVPERIPSSGSVPQAPAGKPSPSPSVSETP